jgi:Family of unknown function (DUF6340)
MKISTFFIMVLFSILCSLNSCAPSTQIRALKPAQMKIDDHIATIAIIDRSKPSKGWLTALEGAVTGESIGQDKDGRRKAVQGLAEALSKTPRFSLKETGIELIGSETGSSMLPPMDWNEVMNICQKYGADALAVIEMFDSDQNIQIRRNSTKIKSKSGGDSTRIEFEADRRLDVKLGWRLYDPKTKIIVDEVMTTRGGDSREKGDTEQKARARLPSIYRVVDDVSYGAGLDYGARIAPTWITLNRTYFGKTKGIYEEKMKQATRYAEASDWLKAAEIWQPIAQQNTDIKTAGKAAFNMAVANESLGKLDSALDWAKKAFTEFGNKEAKNYIEVLKMRQNDERKVEHQLTKPKV